MSATHISGANITYRWINGNTYEINLTLYRDCSGIAAPASVSITYSSATCGYNLNAILNRIPVTGQEITRPCDSTSSICSGGTNPGVQKYEYRGTVNLPAQCNDWIFGYSICCRNCAITTLTYSPNNCAGVPGTYVEATLDNLNAPNNSSPVFTNDPVYFYCIGQPLHYNLGVIDTDGDSIVYSLINPRSSPTNDVVFSTGYSSSNPISSSPPLTLSTTGNITMNPVNPEVGVMAILVKEYRNGVLIGTIVQDIEMWTSNCSNHLPSVSGVNGSTNFNIVACPGNPLSFTINSSDSDPGQLLTMNWNQGIPGATFTTTTDSFPVGTFNWTPTTANARSQPYTFTVTVRDDNCPNNGFQIFSFNVTVPAFTVTINSTNSSCANPGNGTATAIPAGSGPFQYLWSPGNQTTPSISGLSSGTYSVTVTDANGCTSSASTTITSAFNLSLSLVSLSNPVCNDSGDGSISVNATGGSPPYSYLWSPGNLSGPTITGLYSGNYSVTVTDNFGCSASASYSIVQPPVLNAVMTSADIVCHGASTGTASVSASGGTSPYTYLWSNGGNTFSVLGLTAGNYGVTVTDGNGCTQTRSVTITEPPAITISLTKTDATCGLNNGKIISSVSGGVGPYSYLWDPVNITTPNLNNINAGLYILNVTDMNGCVSSAPGGISNSTGPLLSLQSFSNVKCNGGSDGAAVVNAIGNGPFTYQWSPVGGNTASASNLPAGNYTITVTDINNCTSSLTVLITEPQPLTTNILSINPTCSNSTNGSAAVIVNGGTPGYTYLWTPGNVSSQVLNNIPIGIYTVTVTDLNGCIKNDSLNIWQPLPIAATSIITTSPSCFGGNNGSAQLTISGGHAPYRYSWFPTGDTLSFATGLAAGTYPVTVTDLQNCTQVFSVVVSGPPQLTSTIGSTRSTVCVGGFDGNANANVSGGTSPYTFVWSPLGQTTSSLTNLAPGNYSVSVTDVNGCNTTSSITINEEAPLAISFPQVTNPSCFGSLNGTATAFTTGGLGPFSYQWLPSGGTASVGTNLSAGNYTVTATDAIGCSASASVGISQPSPLTATTTVGDASCFGSDDGTATAVVNGGTAPYTYLWSSSGGNAATAMALTAGNYSVTVTDAKGCTTTATASVGQPSEIIITSSSTTSTCGTSFGETYASASGGVPGYTYSWSPVLSTDSFLTNIPVGIYTVVVEDATGCTASVSTSVINTNAPVITSVITPVSCKGGNNGAATLTLSGGYGPFSYLWTPLGGNSQTATGLTKGTYTVEVTDSFDCVTYYSVNIPEIPKLQVSLTAVHVSCNGGNNGSISSVVTGGTAPFTYSWSTGAINVTSVNGLSAGNYSVQVTDANGCTTSSTATINQPTTLIASVTGTTHVSCFGGNDGTTAADAAGGTPPYLFEWNPGTIQSQFISGLQAGNYTVTVTDLLGCTALAGSIVTQPAALTLQTSSTAGSCNLPNGLASVIPSGGTLPYSYHWEPVGVNTSSINNLAPGVYRVTVTDLNGCISHDSVNIGNTGVITASLLAKTGVSCFGGNDGTAQLTVNGGNPPYAYQWTPSGGNSSFAAGLSAGPYVATVSDASNCTQTVSVVINQPPLLQSPVNARNINCFGAGNGSVIVNAVGGTGTYSYLWQPGGMITPIIGSLNAGTYQVQVTDGNGCTATTSAIIMEPQQLTVTVSSTPAGCLLSNGSATAIASGGTAPLYYSWNPSGIQSGIAANQPAGSYTVNVTDSNSCFVSAVASISNYVSPTATLASANDVHCNGGTDGNASITVTGGAPPYEYNWFPFGGHASSAGNLTAGSYSVTVRDTNNCMAAVNVTINEPLPFITTVTSIPVTCFGYSDGGLNAITTGGTFPYRYLWSNGDTLPVLSNLFAGNYSLAITDSQNCIANVSTVITTPPPISISLLQDNIDCNGGNDGNVVATVTGGTPAYVYSWSNGSSTQSANNLIAGNYQFSVTDSHACTADTSVLITEPPALALSATTNDVTCKNQANGSASVQVSGGVAPYQYEWLPFGGSADNASDLKEGDYTVIVTDNNLCTASIPIHIGSPQLLVLSTTENHVRCFGGNDGSLNVTAGGGTPPYSYFWSNGSDSTVAAKLPSGTYSVIVTDAQSCTATTSVNVLQPDPIQLTIETPSRICIGNQVKLNVSATGGTPGYSFAWNNGISGSMQNVSPETTTVYYVLATDTNGCISNPALVRVSVNPPLTVIAGLPDTICAGQSIQLIATGSGGDGGPYTYRWNTGDKTDRITVSPRTDTSYFVTVSDTCGTPPATFNIPVQVNSIPVVNFMPDTISGCQPLSVNFKDLTGPDGREYYWNFGDGGTDTLKDPSHVFVTPGSYSVNHIVTDLHGCVGKKVVASAIKVYPFPIADFEMDPETASVFLPQISFADQSTHAARWEWDFGDKSPVSTIKNNLHTYNDTGKYQVRLITTSEFGCLDTTYGTVTIKGEFAFYIPNAFTPNGDGVNDLFAPLSIGVKDFEMSIYDRWGLQLYKSTDIQNGWNGRKDNGDTPCQMDVYVYIIRIIDLGGKSHEYVGHMSLVR